MLNRPVIRKMHKSEIASFIDVIARCYPSFDICKPEAKERLLQYMNKMSDTVKTITLFGMYNEDSLIGGMRLFDFEMNMHQTFLPVGGVGLVAIDLLHKKKGYAKDLITHFINHYRNANYSMVVLYPFRPDFYHQMGFGIGQRIYEYSIKPQDFLSDVGRCKVRYAKDEDATKLLACYDAYCHNRFGMMKRHMQEFEPSLKNPNIVTVLYEEEAEVQGYMQFQFKANMHDNPLEQHLEVKEFVYNSPTAFKGLCGFIHMQKDQIDLVKLQLQDEHLIYSLFDPRDNSKHFIHPVYQQTSSCGVGLMYRIVNFELFIKKLGFDYFNHQTINLSIDIEDSFIPEHAGKRYLKILDGVPKIVKSIPAKHLDAEIKLPVAELSSVIMGCADVKKLYNYGILQIDKPELLTRLQYTFQQQQPECLTSF